MALIDTMKDLVDIFLQPGPVLLKQYEKPNGWLPVLLLAVAAAAFAYLYFSKVDGEWFMRAALDRQGRELTREQIDAQSAVGGGSAMLIWPSTILALAFTAVFQMILGLYYMLAGKLAGLAVGFKQGLGLAGWSAMPTLIGTLLGIYGTFGMSPQTYIDALSLTTLDPMLVQLPPESPWKTLATSSSFLTLWTIGLAALGWRLWSRGGGWVGAILVAALPQALIVSFQALKALLA